jgi:hypothetical protein
VIRLYAEGKWVFADRVRADGFSVVLFGAHGRSYRHPPAALIEGVRRMPGVSSVQITFHENRLPERHAMPPGGFRLAIVNAWSLKVGIAGRNRLSGAFM